jgi:DNA uptake protein ComE-like DNA-binding protein
MVPQNRRQVASVRKTHASHAETEGLVPRRNLRLGGPSQNTFSHLHLRSDAQCVQNRAVFIRTKLAVLGFPLLGVCLAGITQNHDPATRGTPATVSTAPSPEQRVDINSATLEELMKIPGITRVWGERIVRFRPYRTKADLEEQGVLPEELYSRIKDYVIAHRIKQ